MYTIVFSLIKNKQRTSEKNKKMKLTEIEEHKLHTMQIDEGREDIFETVEIEGWDDGWDKP